MGLLPNSGLVGHYWSGPQGPPQVAAGGPAHDGAEVGAAKAVLLVLARRRGPQGPLPAPLGLGRRLLVRARADPPALQPHRQTLGGPRRALQAQSAGLP